MGIRNSFNWNKGVIHGAQGREWEQREYFKQKFTDGSVEYDELQFYPYLQYHFIRELT